MYGLTESSFSSHCASWELLFAPCLMPGKRLSQFVVTFTLASHTARRASCKLNAKSKRISDLPSVIWKRQEATKSITVSMSFISELCSLTTLCEIYQSLWGFLNLLNGLLTRISLDCF